MERAGGLIRHDGWSDVCVIKESLVSEPQSFFICICFEHLREDLKSKGRTVHEKVYRFLDEGERMVGFYNSEGMLVSSRPARREELQKTVFTELRKEGTNN